MCDNQPWSPLCRYLLLAVLDETQQDMWISALRLATPCNISGQVEAFADPPKHALTQTTIDEIPTITMESLVNAIPTKISCDEIPVSSMEALVIATTTKISCDEIPTSSMDLLADTTSDVTLLEAFDSILKRDTGYESDRRSSSLEAPSLEVISTPSYPDRDEMLMSSTKTVVRDRPQSCDVDYGTHSNNDLDSSVSSMQTLGLRSYSLAAKDYKSEQRLSSASEIVITITIEKQESESCVNSTVT